MVRDQQEEKVKRILFYKIYCNNEPPNLTPSFFLMICLKILFPIRHPSVSKTFRVIIRNIPNLEELVSR